mgnify:CR=1 FL=1
MPRGATTVVENNFTKGLITELTAMNFPENAVTDADNVVFSELGAVTRRKGFDFEGDYEIHSTVSLPFPEGTFSEFKWATFQDDENVNFVVQQIGTVLWFFEAGSSISGEKKSFTVDLTTFKVPGVVNSDLASKACQFASGKGYLFVVHPLCEPFSIQYDSDTDTITTSEIDIKVRDFERLEDNLEIDERPSILSANHNYNLLNQGWYFDAMYLDPAGFAVLENVLEGWDISRDDYPSNADIWWLYKNSLDIANFVKGRILNGGVFYVSPETVTLGNTPAPNGHYIYNAFDIDRTTETSIPSLPRTQANQARPSAVAFYAGRVFFAGVGADKYSDKIYFSQLIESDDQIGKCFQVNDPTSETTFDLVDTDGGVISIPSLSKVVTLKVINDSLIVIGTNGTFAIRGTDNSSFKATDYSVEYLSSVGGISASSVLEVDNNLMWWNNDAIYGLFRDQSGLNFSVQNLSKQTIQSIVDGIPTVNKRRIKGAYNRREQIVHWLYNDVDDSYFFNRILAFNVVSQAFYTFTITTADNPKIVGILAVSGDRRFSSTEDVVDSSSVVVTDTLLNDVEVEVFSYIPDSEIFKYTTSGQIAMVGPSFAQGLTYSNLDSESLRDWVEWSGDGTEVPAEFTTGYRIRGEFLRKFQSTPIVVVLGWVDGAQVYISGLWDYGLRETTSQALYNLIEFSEFKLKRVKLRGKGRSLQLKFVSEGDAPFIIYGWSSYDTGGTIP